jgi:hypothetical protein
LSQCLSSTLLTARPTRLGYTDSASERDESRADTDSSPEGSVVQHTDPKGDSSSPSHEGASAVLLLDDDLFPLSPRPEDTLETPATPRHLCGEESGVVELLEDNSTTLGQPRVPGSGTTVGTKLRLSLEEMVEEEEC